MQCTEDFSPLGVSKRRQLALSAHHAGGIDIYKSVSLVAVSVSEAGAIWNMQRAPSLIYSLKAECWQCRAVIGWEYNFADKEMTKKILHPNNGSDPEAKDYVLSNGLASVGGDGLLYPTTKGGLLTPNSDAIARWFEWAVQHRKAKLLTNWSIGPTQMHLLWSDLYLPYRGAAAKTRPYWLQTWEQIFDFYMSDSVYKANAIQYLDPGKCTSAKTWPSQHPEDEVANRAWLTYCQTGTGFPDYYTKNFYPNLKATLADAKSLGLL